MVLIGRRLALLASRLVLRVPRRFRAASGRRFPSSRGSVVIGLLGGGLALSWALALALGPTFLALVLVVSLGLPLLFRVGGLDCAGRQVAGPLALLALTGRLFLRGTRPVLALGLLPLSLGRPVLLG